MRRMFSEKQIKEMISAGAQGEIAEALEGDISIGGDLSVAGDSSVTGDQSVGGDLSVTGDIAGADITGDSIIENMSGYSATLGTDEHFTFENVYTGAVKNGNKLTLVSALNVTKVSSTSSTTLMVRFSVPNEISAKLYPATIGSYSTALSFKQVDAIAANNTFASPRILCLKSIDGDVDVCLFAGASQLEISTKFYIRVEITFLLSDDIVSSGE